MKTIEDLCIEVKISYIRENYKSHVSQSKQKGDDFEKFLFDILNQELAHRRNNGIKRRIRMARFPQKKYIEDFKVSRFSNYIRKNSPNLKH